APSGAKLSDGSVVWAFLDSQGKLYTRRNVGTLAEPGWKSLVTVPLPNSGTTGADSPSLLLWGTRLALVYAYPDTSSIVQAWLSQSTDSGATWGTPTQLTTETTSVNHVQGLVDGSTVYLFWSQQSTSRSLQDRTSTATDLNSGSWTTKASVSQQI